MTVKSATINGLILVAVLSISALALEFAVRVAFPVFDPSGQLEFRAAKNGEPVLGIANGRFRQRKNTGDFDVTVAFNRYGFRDDKDLATSVKGDLFVVGDSFSMGWGVEAKQRYSDRLQALTGRRTFNISTPGDLDHYRRLVEYAERQGAHVRDLVIGACMENDLADYDAGETSDSGEQASRLLSLKGWLTEHSALYAMTTMVVHTTPALRNVAVRLGLITPNLAGVPQRRYSAKVVASSAERVVRLAEGRRAVVLIIPSRSLWVGARREAADRTHVEFAARLRQAGLDVVDLRPRLEATGDPLSFHFKNDGHWNARGHEVAARALAEYFAAKAGGRAKE